VLLIADISALAVTTAVVALFLGSDASTFPSVTTIEVWCFGFFGQVARLDQFWRPSSGPDRSA
jgi:hypothetical protein